MGVNITCTAYGFRFIATVIINLASHDNIIFNTDLVVVSRPCFIAKILDAICSEHVRYFAVSVLDSKLSIAMLGCKDSCDGGNLTSNVNHVRALVGAEGLDVVENTLYCIRIGNGSGTVGLLTHRAFLGDGQGLVIVTDIELDGSLTVVCLIFEDGDGNYGFCVGLAF